MSKWGEMQWGDEDQDGKNDTNESRDEDLPMDDVQLDADGVTKTYIEHYKNDEGQIVQTRRKVKVTTKLVRVNRNVVARRQWIKFGDLEGKPPGVEPNTTYKDHNVIHLDLRPKKREDQEEEQALDKLKPDASVVICRNCGEQGHWTLKCPQRNSMLPSSGAAAAAVVAIEASASAGGGSKYIPLHLRKDKSGNRMGGGVSMQRDDTATLRVTNLSEDVTEDDLGVLFRRFGRTTRIYLAKDRLTNRSRGFAFINYASKDHAQAAIDKLDGHGYDNLILHVECAKPREERVMEVPLVLELFWTPSAGGSREFFFTF